MKYIAQGLDELADRAFRYYRFYLYWLAQETRARSRSSDKLRATQWSKFTRLLEFAYSKIPLYREKFRQAGITPESVRTREDLVRIPILTKDEIRQNFPDRLVDADRRYPPSMLGQTSGSTGESLHFVKPDLRWTRSLDYSVLLRIGRPRNLRVLVFTTPHCSGLTCSLDDEDDEEYFRIRKLDRIGFLRHLAPFMALPSSANILRASDQYMERLLAIVSAHAPCLMIADPVYLGAFARYLRRTRKAPPPIVSIITTYELLTGSLRELLTGVFGCDIYVQYGSSEINDIANECACRRLHVHSSQVMVEAIRHGRPAQPGELGRAVVTDLSNYNMPFIRYDIGDVITLGDGPCPCGRNTETIERIHGRTCDTIGADGAGRAELTTPLQVDDVFRGLSGVGAYRLVQREPDLFDVSVMPDGAPGSPDGDTVVARCRSLFGQRSQVRVRAVDEILPQASKKFRFVYSEVGPGEL